MRANGKTFRSRVLSIGVECVSQRRKIFLLSRPGGADKFSRKEKLVNQCAILDEKGLCESWPGGNSLLLLWIWCPRKVKSVLEGFSFV